MITRHALESRSGRAAGISLQRQWPQLGRELFTLERALTATLVTYTNPLTEQEQTERREVIKSRVLAQLYRDEEKYPRDARYRAFLLVKKGRAGEIVGNPCYIDKNGTKRELPYTGLEGYFAGSEKTPVYPGLTREEIIQEEAHRGIELLSTIKKRAVEKYTWAKFARLKKVLEDGETDIEDLRIIVLLWAEVTRRLHVRVYNNQEFEATITEQIEQLEKLVGGAPSGTEEEKEYKTMLQAEYQRLKNVRNNMGDEEKEKERRERRERERIRRERLRAFDHFREETYNILNEVGTSKYDISVRDLKWAEATIIETICVPKTLDRNDYPSFEVRLTPEQVEGYLFLTQLGEIGGDPLARSVLISD